MDLSSLDAISPVDGRYRRATAALADYFSESALTKYRVRIEVEYFLALCELPLPQLDALLEGMPPVDALLLPAGLNDGADAVGEDPGHREDPGRRDYNTRTIPKVVGGHTEQALAAAEALYGAAVNTVVNQVPWNSATRWG